MSLKTTLRKAGYDLIDSPVRNHKLLQIWIKNIGDPPTMYYQHINHALESTVKLETIEDPALTVNHRHKQDYNFNIGITVLDNLLTALGLGNLGASLSMQGGKNVTISYSNSKTLVIPVGSIEQFLNTSDFTHPNKNLLQNANRNKLILITGTLVAQDVKAIIQSNNAIDASLEADLNELAEGRALFSHSDDNTLEMTSEGNTFFPIAIQAYRLDWDHGEFDRMKLITDNRNLF